MDRSTPLGLREYYNTTTQTQTKSNIWNETFLFIYVGNIINFLIRVKTNGHISSISTLFLIIVMSLIYLGWNDELSCSPRLVFRPQPKSLTISWPMPWHCWRPQALIALTPTKNLHSFIIDAMTTLETSTFDHEEGSSSCRHSLKEWTLS